MVDSPSVLRCAKMEMVFNENNPIVDIEKRLSCDLTKYVGEVILNHDIMDDTRKLVEPFSSYLGKLGIEVDLSEVKSMFKSDFFWNAVVCPTLVIRYTKSKQENPVFMCLDIWRIKIIENYMQKEELVVNPEEKQNSTVFKVKYQPS